VTPPFDLEMVERETDGAIAAGHRIFQTHRYADTDAGQVQYLLDILDPPEGAMVLDAGCGIGEVARLMAATRRDLFFILMNLSMHQLAKCPEGIQFMHALDDCQATLLRSNVVDCVMFSSALCQMDTARALGEAHRVLNPGGVLLVNDMAHPGGHLPDLEQILAARVLGQDELVALVEQAGFTIDRIELPSFDASHFIALAKDAGIAEHIHGIYPIIIRATARKEA
jgi:SAM-dependent methyltransferase